MSRVLWWLVGAAAATLLLAACETMTPEQRGMQLMEEGYQKVEGAEAERLFNDTTMYDTNGGWVLYVAADGSARFKSLNKSFSDQGRIEVRGGRLCAKWTRIRRGAEACFDTYRKGDAYTQVRDDGQLGQTFTMRSGNPEGL